MDTTVGNVWSDLGGFVQQVGNTVGVVQGAIKGGQNNSDTKPSVAQQAASQSNTRLIIFGVIAVVVIAVGTAVAFMFRGGKSK